MWNAGQLRRTDSTSSVTRSVSQRSSVFDDGNQKPMWNSRDGATPTGPGQRPARTPSVHSINSMASARSSSFGDSPIMEKSPPPRYETWQAPIKEPAVHEIRLERRQSISSDASHSTLAEAPMELDLKTPTIPRKIIDTYGKLGSQKSSRADEPPTPSGPLELQLLALLSKIKLIEHDRPTVMADEFKQMQDRVTALENEKKTWQKRHEALYALRDEDLANLIKVRGMLAKERREHDGLKKLRDDDLKNLIEIRGKLAEATWSKPRSTPDRSDSTRTSFRQSMQVGGDLWQSAKTAALEQRLLELEHANATLKQQLGGKGGVGIADSVHPAAMGSAPASNLEGIFESTVRHRERSAVKVQQLRSENETLRKEVARLEDKAADLEDEVHRLRRTRV